MARVKLSEFRGKNLIYDILGHDYTGCSVDLTKPLTKKEINVFSRNQQYVVKVDQALKKRGKNGLVFLQVPKEDIAKSLDKLAKKGFDHALVEPFIPHEQTDEHYLAMARTDKGVEVSYSPKGGVDIESSPKSITRYTLSADKFDSSLNKTELENEFVQNIYELFQRMHMTLLEINPLLVQGSNYLPLDAAVEVDGAAEFFANGAWTEKDVREAKTNQTNHEKVIEELKAVSPASFNLKVLNPNGSIFLLLSGGGASVVVADEIANKGDYKNIANYGEYSGNPTEDETYLYTKELIKLLLNSKSRKKVLLIAGGIANFTDVAKTFAGIIRAIDEGANEIRKQKVKLFVRRGGPNQEEGLKTIESFLERRQIDHEVHGPEYSLGGIATMVAKAVK